MWLSDLLGGTPAKYEQVSSLLPSQQGLHSQLMKSLRRKGAGGAFGDVSDYYRDLLSEEPEDYESYLSPEMRKYYEEIMPGIAERYAGMGLGGLSSSAHRNAQMQAGTDLAERLARLRAGLRQSGAQGLTSLGSIGLQPRSQMMQTQQGSSGLLSGLAQSAPSFLSSFF
jgi:hypothetical protein